MEDKPPCQLLAGIRTEMDRILMGKVDDPKPLVYLINRLDIQLCNGEPLPSEWDC